MHMARSDEEADLSGDLHLRREAGTSMPDCASSRWDVLLSALVYAVSWLFLLLVVHRSTDERFGVAHSAHKVQHGHTEAFLCSGNG